MRAPDAVLWNIEDDPTLRSTVVAVSVLDRSPDWEELRDRVRYATEVLPVLRRRVRPPSLPLMTPSWDDRDGVDLEYHLRRVRPAGAGSLRGVLDLAEPIAMQAFDPDRPLWELTLVDGLDGGGAALVQKFHHAIMDGEGAIAFERLLLDGAADDGHDRGVGEDRDHDRPLGVLARTWRTSTSAAASSVRSVMDPVGTTRTTWRTIGSVGRALAPVPATASTLLTARSTSRRLDALDVRLDDLRAAAHLGGGTINDAFLAAVVGGLARYHEVRGAPIDVLRLTMPISIRHREDALDGNRFAPARFSVPATITDPVDRIAALGELARAWQHEPFLAQSDRMAGVLARLPRSACASIFGGMLRHVDAVATNVAGLERPASLAGASIVRQYAFAPTMGAAVNVALLSHGDHGCIGVELDAAAIPDDDVFVRALSASFDEVISLVDHHARRTA